METENVRLSDRQGPRAVARQGPGQTRSAGGALGRARAVIASFGRGGVAMRHHDHFRPDWFAAPADAARYAASGSWGAYAAGLHSARPIFCRVSGPASRHSQRRRPAAQLDQHRCAVGPATINAAASALRFLFTMTLKRPEIALGLSVIRCEPKLRDVLSVEEAARLIEAAPSIVDCINVRACFVVGEETG